LKDRAGRQCKGLPAIDPEKPEPKVVLLRLALRAALRSMFAQFADDLADSIPDMWRQHLDALGPTSPRVATAAERALRMSPGKSTARSGAAAGPGRQSQHQNQQQSQGLSKQQQAVDQLWEQGTELRSWRNQLQGCLEVIRAAGKEQGTWVEQLEEHQQQAAALQEQLRDVSRVVSCIWLMHSVY
jgi:hypothetical protein